MADYSEEYFEELADAAERGELIPVHGTAKTGENARKVASQLLIEATGTDDYEKLVQMARGRRKLAENKEKKNSPVLHLRVPEELNNRIRNLATERGQSTSEVARELLVKGLATV